jgi:acyl carrier protein
LDDVRPKLRAFLARFIRDHDLGDEEDIFAAGHVNSLFVMQLVLFVESEFGCTVEDDDLDIDNFNTVAAIAALVARKRSAIGVSARVGRCD